MVRFIFWIFVLIGLSACDKTPDEEQIARNIDAMQAAVESKDFTEIKDYLHDDFIANNHLSALEVNQMLRMYSARHADIGVTVVQSKTVMDPAFSDRAESKLSVVVTGSTGRLPSDGSVRSVRIAWVKESGDWLVREAQWQHYQGSKKY